MGAHRITSEAELDAVYGEVVPAAKLKEQPAIIDEIRQFLEASPFVVIGTVGPEGLDCSPRGDPAGQLIRIIDERTIQLPDRRGNNRVDSLRNIVRDPRVALLFLIPGMDETLRVNGRATVSTDPALREFCAIDGRVPKVAIGIDVDTAGNVWVAGQFSETLTVGDAEFTTPDSDSFLIKYCP